MDDIKRILVVTKSTKQCKKAVHHAYLSPGTTRRTCTFFT